jgi:hypothetical protein
MKSGHTESNLKHSSRESREGRRGSEGEIKKEYPLSQTSSFPSLKTSTELF